MAWQELRQKITERTKQQLRDSFAEDQLIIFTIRMIDDLDRVINILSKRLRDACSPFIPEVVDRVRDHEAFASLVEDHTPKEIFEKENITSSMGSFCQPEDWKEIQEIADEVKDLAELRKKQASYLEQKMRSVMPNTLTIAGATVGARLLDQSGSLKELSRFPASTIQILGAEKALFRHLRTKSRAPKHGFLHEHPLVQKSKNKGKASRMLADKIAIAAKVDFFKGDFIGEQLKAEIERRLQ